MNKKLMPIYKKLEEKFGEQPTKNFETPEDMALFLFNVGSDFMVALNRPKMLFSHCITQLRRVSP